VEPRTNRRAGTISIALVLALALLAACAKDQTSGQGGGGATPDTQGASSNITQPTSGQPKPGGKVVYGVEAETSGWDPTVDRWAISGTVVGLALYDPLAARDKDGIAQPYLAQKFESSSDFKTWTVTLRPNITFHDGSPLTADAVKQVYEAHLKSGLTRPAFGPLQSVEVTGPLTVQFNMSTPWAIFPGALTGQAGVIASPNQLNNKDTSSAQPVGTGPFQFVSWTRDNELVTKKYPNYWRKDQNGQQMPYLNELSFRPLTDNAQRKRALESGQLQMFHTSDGPTIQLLRADAQAGKIQLIEDRGESEEGFVMFNTSKPPFNNVNARKAVAYATNRDDYIATVSQGSNLPADGPFAENSPWYAKTNFPHNNLEEAKKYAQMYQQETGQPLTFTLGVGGPDTRDNGEFLQQAWKQAGIDAQVNVVSQDSFIIEALGGNYQANLWRQFGSPDPDGDYLWWTSENADDALSLNFARHQDAEIDAALKQGRESTDPNVRKEAYKKLQERFAERVPYVWLDRSLWAIAAANDVRGIENGPLPDGQPSMPIGGAGFPGVHRFVQTWIAAS
jgi:peptide/nickel transport system substrate-binding protein